MEPEPARRNELWSALLAVFGSEPVTDANRTTYQQAARALWQAGATPAEVQRRARLMREAYTIPLTPGMLAKHWSEYSPVRQRGNPPGLFWHPDRCPSPCIGCAADRKVGTS